MRRLSRAIRWCWRERMEEAEEEMVAVATAAEMAVVAGKLLAKQR